MLGRMFGGVGRSAVTALVASLVLTSAYNLATLHGLEAARYNWDIIPYNVLALIWDGQTIQEAHAAIYGALREAAPPTQMRLLAPPTYPFRWEASTSPEMFAQQLPFYGVKPLYPAAIWLLYQTGMSPLLASAVVSGAFYVGCIVVAVLWLRLILPTSLALAVAAVIFTRATIVQVAFQPTPDSMSAFAVLLAFYLAVRRSFPAALLIAAIAVLIRPDNVIWALLLCGYVALERRSIGIGAGVLVAGLFVAVTHHAYPWPTFFYHTFIDRVLDPETFVSPYTFKDYVAFYAEQIPEKLAISHFLKATLVLGTLCVGLRIWRHGWRDAYALLTAIVMLHMSVHFAIMPAALTRHMMPFYVVILIAATQTAVEHLKARRSA